MVLKIVAVDLSLLRVREFTPSPPQCIEQITDFVIRLARASVPPGRLDDFRE